MVRKLKLFDGPLLDFCRKYKLIRRAALVGGVVVGLFFIGRGLGWW